MTEPADVPALPSLEAAPEAREGDPGPRDLALVMGGGGARAAYQVGFLRCLARRCPDLSVPYVTGVSAGAINAAHLASHHGSFIQAVDELSQLWGNLRIEDVFEADAWALIRNVGRWGAQLLSGASSPAKTRGLVDTSPLRSFLAEALHAVDGELTGIEYNLRRGRLRAVAISTASYTTGQSIVWVQGTEGVEAWERPGRRARVTRLTLDHVMASTALPLFFPAVRVEDEWYGDGGMRLTAPLSPALHLGANRVIAISTRYGRSRSEADERAVEGYPPPAQVAGVLLNSIFLDLLDNDAVRLRRINELIEKVPPEERGDFRKVRLLTLRPSRDLGKLAGDFEPRLPRSFRFMTRGLGTRETESPDFLSLVLFQPDYLRTLMEIGERDAEEQSDEIMAFLDDG